MAYIPRMEQTGAVVALIASVLDSRDGGDPERAREMGKRIGMILAEDPGDYVTTSAFVAAALAELAGEALGIAPEEVLAVVLAAGTTGDDQDFTGEDHQDEHPDGAAES